MANLLNPELMDVAAQNALRQSAVESVPRFSMEGRVTLAKIVSVYDGDTFDAVVYADPSHRFLVRVPVRLVGCNCPERKTRDVVEKVYGEAAKRVLEELVLNKMVYLQCGKWDKFGRLLARVYVTAPNSTPTVLCVNQWMIDAQWAKSYDGQSSRPPFVPIWGTQFTNAQDLLTDQKNGRPVTQSVGGL